MNQRSFVLPKPFGKLLSLLPAYPGSLLFVTALNLALKDRLPEDVRQSLAGKRLRIGVSDARLNFDFKWADGAFCACQSSVETDLTISASAHDFLLLAQRLEDPDTLFFSRRLSMEGDTALGLLVKNTIDAIDLPVFDLAKMAPAAVLARFTKPRTGNSVP